MTTPDSEGLRPCPFCGGDGEICRESLGYTGYWPRCPNDKCIAFNMEQDGEMGGVYVSFDTEAEAIAAWNRRTEEGK